MVTASHNENGWTGVNIGAERPLTFDPVLMTRLKDITLSKEFVMRDGGAYKQIENLKSKYLADLSSNKKISRKLKAVVACGNGTAGAFAPHVLKAIGVDVIEMDCTLDYTFPHYNPNPEDLEMLHALSKRVIETGADIGFAFDGDGDRCGVVDNTGDEIFADKMGVIMARDLAKLNSNAKFVVDVKSTGLFSTDPVLKSLGATTDYFKTGHSYIKRRVNELNALAGFEKSGHFFFGAPIGRGYDDGILTAVTICQLLDRASNQSMADLKHSLPKTWGSPTMAPFCPDDQKYKTIDRLTAEIIAMKNNGTKILGQTIESILTVNGVRFTLTDGTWGLIRASSNKPSLVVVVESPVSDSMMRNLFAEIETILAQYPEIGEFDQKLPPKAA
jgi:phosphomannomutase/phosphoglucomutase